MLERIFSCCRVQSQKKEAGIISSIIKILDPFTYKKWNEVLLNFKEYSFFHSLEWLQVIQKTYNYKSVVFALQEQDEIKALLPTFIIDSRLTGRRLVSLPFSDFCEPLFSSSVDIEQIKREIFSYCKINNLSYVEFRSSEKKFPFDTQQYRTDLRHILYLNKSEDELLRSFSENNRRNIKKAAKQNVMVDIYNNSEGLNSFYEMFCVTRKKHGLPPQPFSFFRNIFELIIRPGYGDIILAKHNDNYIAGAMYFKFGEKILYKFGASYTQHNDLRANNAVMWFAIRKYLNENYKEFDFGRTETFHEGLRKFKLGWNTEERIIYTTRFDIKKSSYQNVHTKTEGVHNKIFEKLPLFALRFIGETIYKHMG